MKRLFIVFCLITSIITSGFTTESGSNISEVSVLYQATTRQVPIAHLDADNYRVFAFKPLSNGNLGVVSDEVEIDTNRGYETWFGATLGGHISIADEQATFLNFEDFEPITTTVTDLENHATLPQFGLFTTEYTEITTIDLDTGLKIEGTLIVARMTTTQRDSLTAIDGMIIYNTTTNVFNFRENGSWVTKN